MFAQLFEILTNKGKMDTILEIGLDRHYLEHKDELVQFFMSIKVNVSREDLAIGTPLNYYIEENKCSVCDRPANINSVNQFGKDILLCMDHLKNHKNLH